MHFRQSADPVLEQTLQFIVCIRKKDDHRSWQFLDDKVLDTIYNAAIRIDHVMITKVALGCNVDEQGFSKIMLSTSDMGVFNQIRTNIREYNGIPDMVLETFSREDYLEKITLSLYIPKRFAHFTTRDIFRGLFHDYPGIAASYRVMHLVVLENTPLRPHRAGDKIMVVAGDDLLNKISVFPEEFCFHVNAFWRITIKGGERNAEPLSESELAQIESSAAYSQEMARKISGVGGVSYGAGEL